MFGSGGTVGATSFAGIHFSSRMPRAKYNLSPKVLPNPRFPTPLLRFCKPFYWRATNTACVATVQKRVQKNYHMALTCCLLELASDGCPLRGEGGQGGFWFWFWVTPYPWPHTALVMRRGLKVWGVSACRRGFHAPVASPFSRSRCNLPAPVSACSISCGIPPGPRRSTAFACVVPAPIGSRHTRLCVFWSLVGHCADSLLLDSSHPSMHGGSFKCTQKFPSSAL